MVGICARTLCAGSVDAAAADGHAGDDALVDSPSLFSTMPERTNRCAHGSDCRVPAIGAMSVAIGVSRILLLVLCIAACLFADGGSVVLHKQAGAFTITLFADATPVRAGQTVDLSVLCESVKDKRPVTDAQALIRLRRPGAGDIMQFALPAKRRDSGKAVLFEAAARLPSSGKWPVFVDVRARGEEATVSGILDVRPSQPAIVTYWPFFVAVPLLALLFAINLRLRRGRALRHPRAIK